MNILDNEVSQLQSINWKLEEGIIDLECDIQARDDIIQEFVDWYDAEKKQVALSWEMHELVERAYKLIKPFPKRK